MTGRGIPNGGLWVAVALCYAAVASLTPPRSAAATVAVGLPTVVALVAAVRLRGTAPHAPADGSELRRTTFAWAALAGLAVVWELYAWLQQPAYNVASYDHPTVSLLLDPVTDGGPTRVAAWCAWLYVGWRLARR